MLDAFVTAFSYLLAWFIVIGSGWANLLGKRTLEVGFYFGALLVIIPAYLLLYSFFGLYTPKRVLGRRNEFGKIFKANTNRNSLFWSDPVTLEGKEPASLQLLPETGRIFLCAERSVYDH